MLHFKIFCFQENLVYYIYQKLTQTQKNVRFTQLLTDWLLSGGC